MYKPSFPSNFPSTGLWDITYFDENEKGHPVHSRRVFLVEVDGGRVSVMRQRKKNGWDYMVGEKNKYLMKCTWSTGSEPYYTGQWRMYTWMSIIHLTSAITVYK